MALFEINNVAIKGIYACVTKNKVDNINLPFLSNHEITLITYRD